MSLLKPTCNIEFFSRQYYDHAIKECPKLATLSGEPLNDYMLTVLAYNLSYNSFYRGYRKTAIQLLQSVFNSANLDDQVFRAASLLEIQMCVEMNQLKVAQQLLYQLSKTSQWSGACPDHVECFDFLTARCSPRPMIPFSYESNIECSLHWFLLDCENQIKVGDYRNSLCAMFKRRAVAVGNERRILDNAIGCTYAYYLKDCNMAESYFRSAMKRDLTKNASPAMPILSSTIIYHTALAELGSGKPRTAVKLFLSVLPFHIGNPRVWLRIAECCAHCKATETAIDESDALHAAAVEGWRQVANELTDLQFPFFTGCNAEFAIFVIQRALSLITAVNEYSYLLPYVYSLLSYACLRLKHYAECIKAAEELLSLSQLTSRHKLMGVFFKTESLVFMNRLPEALTCILQAIPLQTINYMYIRILYNRAILEALSGRYDACTGALNELAGIGNGFGQRNEVAVLRMYVDMQKRKQMAKQIFRPPSVSMMNIVPP